MTLIPVEAGDEWVNAHPAGQGSRWGRFCPGLEVNKMIVNARKLREALDLLGPVLPGKKPTLEVLTNVLLKEGQ